MKIELYKAYKTCGGWKAVVVDETENYWTVYNCKNVSIERHPKPHYVGCVTLLSKQHDIISEWQEPRTGEVWVNVYLGTDNKPYFTSGYTKREATLSDIHKLIAQKRITWTEGEGL